MARPGQGVITIIHDPVDDPEITHAALAAHDARRGQIVVHPTVGPRSAGILAADILTALGCHITESTARRQYLGSPDAMFAAAASWLLADGIDLLIVLRAHRLTDLSRYWLGKLASAARLRVIAIWHDRCPPSWEVAFGISASMLHETDDLEAALIGAHLRPTAEPELTADTLPGLAALPVAGLASFRAEAYRTLTAAQFAAVDAHYRYGLNHACVWLASHRQYRAVLSSAVSGAAADKHMCPNAPLAAGRSFPIPWPDPLGLQEFLTRLSGSALTPSATIARVRGAQAGMLLHGVALQVPAALARETGPGLTGTCVTEQTAAAIRRKLAHPRLAAAVALTAVTGQSAEDVMGRPIPIPSEHRSDQISAGTGYGENPRYCIPAPAQPLINAAMHFSELRRNDEGHLLAGFNAVEVRSAAKLVGVRIRAAATLRRYPWHTLSAAWIVGEPLRHAPTAEAGTGLLETAE